MIDVNAIRDPAIALHGLRRADKRYTLYYDETNNIRVLRNTEDGFNVRRPKVFVLGGIVHEGNAKDLNFAGLREALLLPRNVSELKFNQIGRGVFLDVLKSNKLTTFLTWLIERQLFVHFQALDVLYWSIVDIVDSILTEVGAPALYALHSALKDALYAVLRSDEDQLAELFHRYDYPNVGRNRRSQFISEVLEMTLAKRSSLDPFSFQMLKGILEMGRGVDALPYLEEEHPNTLIDGFSNFYVQRICLLKNSNHVLDIEKIIQAKLQSEVFMDGETELTNHRFVDSKDEAGVQIADTVVGVIGRAFTYANRTTLAEIEEDLAAINGLQRKNLGLIAKLVHYSTEENDIFSNAVICAADRARMGCIMGE
jgi:hypothetical protein